MDGQYSYLYVLAAYVVIKTIIRLAQTKTKDLDLYKVILFSFIYLVAAYELNARMLQTVPLILQQFSTKILLPVSFLNFITLFIADALVEWILKKKTHMPLEKDKRVVMEFLYRLVAVPVALFVIECVLTWIFIVCALIQIYISPLSPH